jgi:hypothetical protein
MKNLEQNGVLQEALNPNLHREEKKRLRLRLGLRLRERE